MRGTPRVPGRRIKTMSSLSIARGAVRFVMTGALAVAFMAAGYSNRDASAAVNAMGSVVMPLPKPAWAEREFFRGKIVEFDTTYAAGSVVVLSRAKRLYLVLGGGKAVE